MYFDRGRIIANGIYSSGAGVGNFVMAYILAASIEVYHWRGSMFISAAVVLQMCLVGALMREPKTWIEIKKQQKLKGNKSTNICKTFDLYRNSGLVLFFIHMMFVSAGLSIVYVHITAITESLAKVSRAEATLALSLIGLTNIPGRLATGFLGQLKNVDTFMLYVICLTLCGLSAILVPFLNNYTCIITWSAVFGVFISPNMALFQIIILYFVDISDLNNAFAHSCVFVAIGYVAGAPLAGKLFLEIDT
jgi:predicted MFS family arabinose efflux permease